MIKAYNLEEEVKILNWGAYDSDFTLNKIDSRFKTRIKKSSTSLCGIMQKNEMMCFQTLKEKFMLEKQDFLQIPPIKK